MNYQENYYLMQDAFCITYDKWNGKGSFLNVVEPFILELSVPHDSRNSLWLFFIVD